MPTKVPIVKAMVSPGVIYGHESWTIKKIEHWRIVAFKDGAGEDSWESTDSREMKPVNPKGNPPYWIVIARTDAEGEAPIFWPPVVKSQLIGKDPDAGKDWGKEEKEVTENEMVRLHHHLNGHKFEQIPGDIGEHGSLACCSPLGHKESDMTELLNNNSTFKLTFCLTWILQWLLKHSAHIHAGILPICSPLHISGKV